MNGTWFEQRDGKKVYECGDCLHHTTSTERVTACPECGGPVENLSKARAE
jgi:Zn finger protein HypA/HybF involved in hydrogenase expression